MTREEAILYLWRQAIDDLVIVHLDSEAQAIVEVLSVEAKPPHGDLVRGQIRIENARDTSHLDRKTNGVSLPWKAWGWPGRTFVHSFIAACWSAVMAHEGMETVLYKSRFDGASVPGPTRVHDPHTTTVRIDEGTHLATQGRMVELVHKFVSDDAFPISTQQANLEIQRVVLAYWLSEFF